VIEARLIRTLALFFVLALVFGFLQYRWPSIRGQRQRRPGLGMDIFYWFFTPLVTQMLTLGIAVVILLPFYLLMGRSLDMKDILAGYGPITQIPLWIQGLMLIVIGDFFGYWTHRLNHTTHLWKFHAVHHSAETIDWLTANRIHPVNDIFSKGIKAIPVMLLGFSPIAVELYTPALTAYIAFTHANVACNYGPFRYVISSPAFHRWHHEMDKSAWGKNYAGLFPIFDLIFGTFHLPKKEPQEFGLYGESMKNNFIDQMLYPFRTWKIARRFQAADELSKVS
jgi:sterol desaturase/sphingolipid hydroxylase (fatty acid hydroxylase superfamily)